MLRSRRALLARRPRSTLRHPRRAVTAVLAAILMIVMVGMVAFGIDVGYMMLVRTQLQNAADSAAMASSAVMGDTPANIRAEAKEFAGYHQASGDKVGLADGDIEFGTWDSTTRKFAPSTTVGNAIRVTARRDGTTNAKSPTFFGRIFGHNDFATQAQAVAMANPRDICFVVDLSGSMNDDTEPCWATDEITSTFSPLGFPSVGSDLLKDIYSDFGFGSYPGVLSYVGAPLSVTQDKNAYAILTSDIGPLSLPAIPSKYRIKSSDSEAQRKTKAYSWMIDYQIAVFMPKAKPTPSSSTNYAYWAKYLDYIIQTVSITPPSPPSSGGGGGGSGGGGGGGGGPSPPKPPAGWIKPKRGPEWYVAWEQSQPPVEDRPAELLFSAGLDQALATTGDWRSLVLPRMAMTAVTPGTPPTNRGTIPPSTGSNKITSFNNPNTSTFPSAKSSVPRGFRNQIGYRTYVQFMMDFGRDMQPDGSTYTPLSYQSPDCPLHSEGTDGGTFKFPPREQPMHACRRGLIAAIQIVKERNKNIPDPKNRDWVSIVTFDKLTGGSKPVVHQSLTGDYDAAMLACTTIQACSDSGLTTATEAGLSAARNHIKSSAEGGMGRQATNKVVTLLTDGVPNDYESSSNSIDKYMADNSSSEYYGGGYYWLDAPLMQTTQMQAQNWQVFPVGIGLGTDYGFMDRMARMGGTDSKGQSPRGSGNPAEYEQRLKDIFDQIIKSPRVRLVQ